MAFVMRLRTSRRKRTNRHGTIVGRAPVYMSDMLTACSAVRVLNQTYQRTFMRHAYSVYTASSFMDCMLL